MIVDACRAQPWPVVIAYVKPQNEASIRAFVRAGFTRAAETRVHGQKALRYEWRRQS
jgi:RimJ/RimL family protein N-acetyltransferase